MGKKSHRRRERQKEEKGATIVEHACSAMGLAEPGTIIFKGILEEYDHVMYTGVLLNGKPHGFGIMEWQDGTTYDGFWKQGLRDGHGTIKFEDDNSQPNRIVEYRGEWEHDKPTRTGIALSSDGLKYQGDLLNFTRHGKGTIKYADESAYVGDWKNGMRQGNGIMQYYNGFTYTGEWNNDRQNGQGLLYCQNGEHLDTYEGTWMDGHKHGRGTMVYASGTSVYEGWFEHDKRSGYGTLKRNVCEGRSMSIYEGYFEENVPHGYGKLVKENEVYEGIFEHGQIKTGCWVRIDPHDSELYFGNFVNKKFDGKGRYVDSSCTIEGEWSKNLPSGKCQIKWVNGRSYEGALLDGVYHGHGTFTKARGVAKKCFYENGRLIRDSPDIVE